MRRVVRPLLALLLALLLAALSVRVERVGPELAETGNLCGPRMDEICRAPRLNGGWPLGFLHDVPVVSVPNQLGLGEDDFRWGAFGLDVLFYLLVVLLVARLARRVAARRSGGVIAGG